MFLKYTFALNHLHIIVFSVLLVGCGITYKYGDKTYPDRAAAEAAAESHMRSLSDRVQPRASPISGEGIVYTMNRETVLRVAVITENRESEAVQYVADVMYDAFNNVAKVIERRNIFQNLKIIESDGSHQSADPDGRPTIYLYMPNKDVAGWYYISEKIDRTPLSFDTGNPDEFKKFYYLVESIEALVTTERY